MELQITTLIENQPDACGELLYEHGLSLYIEFQGKKLLFDTGQTGDFLKNAGMLDKCIRDIDYIVISHGHYDHSGGVPGLLEYLQAEAEVQKDISDCRRESRTEIHMPCMYVGKEFFVPKYKKLPDGSFHYNGNPFAEELVQHAPVILKKVDQDITYLTENIILFKNFPQKNDFEQTNPKFYVKPEWIGCQSKSTRQNEAALQNHLYVQDEFVDEIALGLVTAKGLVLVVGCSHVGIVNILEAVKERIDLPIYAVLGGTHLVEAKEARIQKTLEAFSAFGVQQIAVSHCTGEAGMSAISDKFSGRFINNTTGNVYRL